MTDLLTARARTRSGRRGSATAGTRAASSWYTGQPDFDETDCIYGDRHAGAGRRAARGARRRHRNRNRLPTRAGSARRSPVLESSIYDGEVYDARLGIRAVRPIRPSSPTLPTAPLTERLSPPLRILDRVARQGASASPKADEWVIDFGQEMTGWVEFNCDLPEGAQRLSCNSASFCKTTASIMKTCARREGGIHLYLCRQKGARPSAFHVLRLPLREGRRASTASSSRGLRPAASSIRTFAVIGACRRPPTQRSTSLIHNAFWGQIGNFLDTPTDCPQRDERMGWTGDAHVFCPDGELQHVHARVLREVPARHAARAADARTAAVPARRAGHPRPDSASAFRHAGVPDPSRLLRHGATRRPCIPWTMYEFYGDKEHARRASTRT